MSKMSWRDTSALKKGASQQRDINFKDLFLRVTPEKGEGNETTNTVRFLECPNAYLVHWPYKKDAELNKLVKADFPDSSEVRKPNRVCHATINAKGKIEENPDCPWCKMGYSKQLRYMVNVISRENGKVMILDAPPDVVNAVYEWVETAMDEGAENCDPSAWDEPTPDFRIKSTRVRGGSIDWRCTPTTKQNKLLPADLELIRQANPSADTDEEALKLYDVNMFTKPSPYGAAVEPTRQTPKAVISQVEEDDDEDIYEAPKATPKPVSQRNAFSDSDPDDDDDDDVAPVSTKKPVREEVEAPAKKSTDSDEFDDWDE